MQCLAISLAGFRNIEQASVRFAPGVNVLYGQNAQGKTNLLEAIYFAAIGKSFRSVHTGESVAFDRESAVISLDFQAQSRVQNITMQLFTAKAKTVEKNHVRIHKMSELVGAFRAVLFCPEQLSLIKGGPAERRQFLDIAISAIEPAYLSALQRYAHILKQRNALIRSAGEDATTFRETVDMWSRQLAHEGAYIARSRKRYTEKAQPHVTHCFEEMTGQREIPTLVYHGCSKQKDTSYEDLRQTEELLYRALCDNHVRELGAGTTLYGIHKDDLGVMLNERDARVYASQGQQRSLALALKLAEGEICCEDCGEYPVFLFDDVLSELDARRREYLLHKIQGKQVILTTCERITEQTDHLIYVQNGCFTEQSAPV